MRNYWLMTECNVWNLVAGNAIRVVKTFRPIGPKDIPAGTILHFVKRDFLPYHSGHTVYFEEMTLYLCDLDETSAIVENYGNEFYEPYVAPPPPLPEPLPVPLPVAVPVQAKPPMPVMPHMRFADMFMELRVRVAQTFRDANGHEYPEGLELRFLQFNGSVYVFVERSIKLNAGDPILENAENAWLYPLPIRDSLQNCAEYLYHGWREIESEEVKRGIERCVKEEPPQCDSRNQPFAVAFLFEGTNYLVALKNS